MAVRESEHILFEMSATGTTLFETLFIEYGPMVRNISLGFMKGDCELANDLTQEVFINIWNGLPAFREQASYKTWIYRVCVNTCLQHIRREKGRKHVSLEVAGQPQDNSQPPDYGELYQAIGRLTEVDRLLIMMVLDEMEYEEIASIMGIHENTLRVKIHRAKQKLKKIWEHGTRNE